MLIALDRDYLVTAGAPGAIAGAIGMSGPYDFVPLRNDRLKAIFGLPDALPRTQPIRFVRPDAPPLLLLQGADDTIALPVNAQRLAERVRRLTGGAVAAYHPDTFPCAASGRRHSRARRAPTTLMPKTGPARDDARPAFTERQFRNALSEFATGVTIITTRDSGPRFVGFTANSFNSVSLAPPLVVWSLSRAAKSHLAFEQCERYAISVLAADQAPLARRFSRPHADRFSGVPYTLGWADAPLIEGAVAWLECRHFSWQPIGDHTLFVGEVVRCARNGGAPLIFHHGGFRTSASLPRRSGDE